MKVLKKGFKVQSLADILVSFVSEIHYKKRRFRDIHGSYLKFEFLLKFQQNT
jgi:hypothetical protein